MRAYDLVPGVPGAGHVTAGGWWHPGAAASCHKHPCAESGVREPDRRRPRPGPARRGAVRSSRPDVRPDTAELDADGGAGPGETEPRND